MQTGTRLVDKTGWNPLGGDYVVDLSEEWKCTLGTRSLLCFVWSYLGQWTLPKKTEVSNGQATETG